jgi:DNA-binding LytR/AlgR family response regulator
MLSKSPPTEKQPTALIVEDEPVLSDELKEALHLLWPELKIVGETQDGSEALCLIIKHQPDIVFLDINIPGPSGLEVARHIAGRCHIVFVTAYDAHAVEAFEKGAVDYILKPLSSTRLFLTVQRLQQKLASAPSNPMHDMGRAGVAHVPSGHLRWITAAVGNSLRMITIDEVVFFQSDQRYTRVVLADSEVLIKKTLKELLEELDPEQFWQIHRSTIVNALEIASIEQNMGGQLAVKLKSRRDQLPISESFVRRFRQM